MSLKRVVCLPRVSGPCSDVTFTQEIPKTGSDWSLDATHWIVPLKAEQTQPVSLLGRVPQVTGENPGA
jgi:hypothetical protein